MSAPADVAPAAMCDTHTGGVLERVLYGVETAPDRASTRKLCVRVGRPKALISSDKTTPQ